MGIENLCAVHLIYRPTIERVRGVCERADVTNWEVFSVENSASRVLEGLMAGRSVLCTRIERFG